jgi:hypothetical protein
MNPSRSEPGNKTQLNKTRLTASDLIAVVPAIVVKIAFPMRRQTLKILKILNCGRSVNLIRSNN